jgi:hypothetical protein
VVRQYPLSVPQQQASGRCDCPIFNGDLVKRALQKEAEAAYAGQKTAQQAMADAAREGNRLLAEGKGG